MSTARKRFAVASGLAPSADEVLGVPAPGRQDVATPPAPAGSGGGRTAFTWRLTAEQALRMEDMMLRVKQQLGSPKVDRAEMLSALVALADENPGVFGALIARMQAERTS
jgi:hypothetical protein